MHVLNRLLIFICLLGGASMLHAQASPTASRVGDLKIGGGFTNANSDYVPTRVNGGMGYFDFDLTGHLGVTGEFHFVQASDQTQVYEKTYLIGGRYYRTYGKLVPYAKFLVGRGVFNFPVDTITHQPTANLAYNMIAIGGGADYKVLPYLYVRGDYEYQRWFGFLDSSLSPSLITVGVAYHFR
jgi:opacity protein-like surface antigen